MLLKHKNFSPAESLSSKIMSYSHMMLACGVRNKSVSPGSHLSCQEKGSSQIKGSPCALYQARRRDSAEMV